MKCNYVVIGGLGSDRYAFGSYGKKVERALAFQHKGLAIQVIQEAALFEWADPDSMVQSA